jgi:hypothetical protein
MAELTNLESKLGEVIGLAQAAQVAGKKVAGLTEDEQLVQTLERMAREAAEAEQRSIEVASTFDGKKTAILDEAREVKQKAAEMMSTYLDEESDALDGFEFLNMAEAAEVAHWTVLGTMSEQAHHGGLQELAGRFLPVQEKHLQQVLQGAQQLAAEEDPDEEA